MLIYIRVIAEILVIALFIYFVSGRLMGIKGQYLIFDGGVINVRKYTGYKVEIQA